MDPITQQTVTAAAGAGGADPLYVDDVFSTYLYDGNGTTLSINNGIDLSGEGGLVWMKKRATGLDHALYDTERGVNRRLVTNSTAVQTPASSNQGVNSFDSNGFTLGGASSAENAALDGYASWTFRKAPGFFDVVTWTGTDGSAQRVLNHSLNSVPGMVICKSTSTSGTQWYIYHKALGLDKFMTFTNGAESSSTGAWNSVTSTTFGLGTSANLNAAGREHVAYLFADDDASFGTDGDESIIKCGTYTGTGGANNATTEQAGPDVNLGFEPQFVMVRSVDSADNWYMFDTMRGFPSNLYGPFNYLQANSAAAEGTFTTYPRLKLTSTGFKITAGNGAYFNYPGQQYIYMAIRRPHKPPEAATEVFAMDYGSTASTIPTFDSGFPIDFGLVKQPAQTDNWWTIARLTGDKLLQPNLTNAEVSGGTNWVSDSMTGWGKTYGPNSLSWMFKRAPGFMDVVAYTGTGSVRTVSHNLNAVPELMIFKSRNTASTNWAVRSNMTSTSVHESTLQNDSGGSTRGYGVGGSPNFESLSAQPTSTVINIASSHELNSSGRTFISYLFATLPGISKVGSYTGTGNAINVDCGFTNGARFVLIKRTDGTGDWYVWDTVRGIVSGNDPYLLLNSTAAEVTTTDYIDPLNAGFTVTSTAPDALNVSGGTYIFLAIA
jgi:hypothetical protein